MRTPFLAAVLGLGLAGCLIGDGGISTPGGDDGTTNPDPGSTPGGSNGSNTNNNPTPKLDASVDKATISTELLSSNPITVTLHASGGFAGAVALTASAVDGAGTAIPGWTVTLDKASVDVAADGTATAVAMVKVPSTSAAAQGTVKIDATSSLGTVSMSSALTVTKQITVNLTLNGANCVYPADMVGTVNVAQGTKLRWVNGDTANNITIHLDSGVSGLSHQQGSTPPGGAYEQTVGSASGNTGWYCHNRNNPGNLKLSAVP